MTLNEILAMKPGQLFYIVEGTLIKICQFNGVQRSKNGIRYFNKELISYKPVSSKKNIMAWARRENPDYYDKEVDALGWLKIKVSRAIMDRKDEIESLRGYAGRIREGVKRIKENESSPLPAKRESIFIYKF